MKPNACSIQLINLYPDRLGKKREKTQFNSIRNERGYITTHFIDIKIYEYYKQL